MVFAQHMWQQSANKYWAYNTFQEIQRNLTKSIKHMHTAFLVLCCNKILDIQYKFFGSFSTKKKKKKTAFWENLSVFSENFAKHLKIWLFLQVDPNFLE